MAKSSSLTLAQWIFLLIVIWGSMYFAAVIIRQRGGLEKLFDPPPIPGAVAPVPEWRPPEDTVEMRPARADQATLETHRGKAVSAIIAEIRAADPDTAPADNDPLEAVRLDPLDGGMGHFPAFPDRAAEAGLEFGAENLLHGSGNLGAFDLDGDGHRDLQTPAKPGTSELLLLRNRGDGQFEIAAEADPFPGGNRIGAADFDNDGDLDLFVVRSRLPNSLLENRGDGEFTDITESAGLLEFLPTAAAVWVDFDRDGRIDLFVASHPDARDDGDGLGGTSCRLYHNRGDGTFRDQGWEAGLRLGNREIRDGAWGDFDGDGFPDLVVSTREAPAGDPPANSGPAPLLAFRSVPADRIEHWRFESIAGFEKVDGAGRIAFVDFDQDGAADLLAGGGVWNPLRLFRNEGFGKFTEISRQLGLGDLPGVLAMEMADLDGDGHEDLALGTAAESANRVFLNRGGDFFREVTGAGGFGILQGSPAVKAADLDGDGDLELLAAADWTGGAVFENPGAAEPAWLTLDLEGVTANRAAIGARVSIVIRDSDWILHRIERVAGESRIEIGLGRAAAIESLEIEWPAVGWPRSVFSEVPLNRLIRIREGAAEFEVADRKPFRLGGGTGQDSGGS